MTGEGVGGTGVLPGADSLENAVLLRTTFHILLVHLQIISRSIPDSDRFDMFVLLDGRGILDREVSTERNREEVGIGHIA